MRKGRLVIATALVLGWTTLTAAQTGLGGLRGVVTDAQGGALPGVTVTATAPEMLGPQTGVTNENGEYRLINLPPGTFTLTAELTGFATFRREGILIRTGSTFQVDVTMQLSTVQETITVTGDSPMIEIDKASNVLNIDGEFQRLMPIQARRNYSDFLELTPGVISRGFDDGSGRQVYFGHATEHFAHVLQLEGTIASNYHDAQLTYVSMGADMVQDTQVKTGGVDAASPMGTGLVMNIITKSGGNVFKGSGAFAYQPYRWNGNNVDNCSEAPGCRPGSGGTPTTAYVRQFDGALGGPVLRDKAWFFAALRRGLSSSGISRTAAEVARIQAFNGNTSLFDNDSESWQPFVKVTSRVGKHDVQAFYQRDRLLLSGDREYNYEPIQVQSTGGPLYSGKVTSVWGSSVTTSFSGSYNGKGGSDQSTFDTLGLSGPQIIIHNSANLQGATLQGTGRILEGGNLQSYNLQPASQIILRGDLTYFKDGWFGNHEVQTGFFYAPRSTYNQDTHYVTTASCSKSTGCATSTTSPPGRCRSAAAISCRSTCGPARPRIATSPSTSRTRGGRTAVSPSTSASAPTSSSGPTRSSTSCARTAWRSARGSASRISSPTTPGPSCAAAPSGCTNRSWAATPSRCSAPTKPPATPTSTT